MAMDRPPTLTVGIFLLLVAVYHANAECKFGCSGGSGNLVKLEPGKSYQYDLSGTTVTTKPGAKGEVSKLSLSAKVEIVGGANCENVITLSNVQTTGPDGKKYSLDKTLGNRLTKFGLDGGKLGKLCVEPEEPQTSLNIKRAVVSLLQVAVSKESGGEVIETDVFGVCPTSLDIIKSGTSSVVLKTRSLNRCALREGLNAPVATPSYYNPSDIQGYSLLNGELKVEQKFDNGVLKSAEAQEVYEYNPTASVEAQTQIAVTTKLTLSGSSPKLLPPAVKCTVEKSLVFDTEHEAEFKGTASEISSLIKKVAESQDVNSESARLFTSLVNAVSVAPKADLLSVYNAVKAGGDFKDKDACRKLFLDALYSSLSASSVEVIAELIKSKDITGDELSFWYLRLGSVKHASRASLTATLPLLSGSPPDVAYLALGQLGGRFCAEHNCVAFGINEVNNFQRKLGEPLLKKGCIPKNHKDEDQLIASIKGLANMKYLTQEVSAKLGECFLNKAVKTRIRSVIADTMSSDAHKSSIKDAAISVFIDSKEDSELRIKAYLVLNKCPCGKVAQHVTDVLESYKSYQVGSFIVTHLKNLKASTNPDRADAQRLLGSITTTKKYRYDARKFSQNLEFSYSLDVLNLGAASEANVIYSQKSWLPRYLSVNLTSQLYGHAFNFLEVGARLENVEKVIEKILGPKGYVSTHSPNDIIEKTKSYMSGVWKKIASESDKVFRPKRSPNTWSELSAIASKVDLGLDSNDMSVDVSLKSFGSEVGWLKLHESDGKFKPEKIVNDLFDKLDDAVKGAKDFDKNYRKYITFSNFDITYPTSLGLALRLKTVGTGAVRVKVDGKIDVPAILKNPQNADLKLQLIPSAALELRGDLSVDGIAVETGVRVALNIHSSTGTHLTFRVLDGHGIDVKVGLPVNNQEIISVKTSINTVVKEDGKPETLNAVSFDTKRESYEGCFDQAAFLLGVSFCGKVSAPWDGPRSILPSYGPSELSLQMNKEDKLLNTYHLKLYQQINEGKANIEFLFDTPGSSDNRKISVVLDAEVKPKKFLKLNVLTPWNKASLDGSVIDTDNEISALAKVNHDGAEYLLKAGAKKSKNGNQLKLEPIFEYKAPETKSSIIGRRTGTKAAAEQQYKASGVILVDLLENPRSRKWKIQSLTISTPHAVVSVDGTGSLTDKGIEADNKFSFGDDSVTLKGHALHTENTRSLHLAVSPSQAKDASFDILFTTTKTGDISNKLDYESKLAITHGPDPSLKETRLSFINKVHRDAKASSLSVSTQVTYPLVQLNSQASFSIKPTSLEVGVKGKFDRYSGGFKLNGDINAKKPGEYNLVVSGDLMKNSMSISSSRKILKKNQSKFVNVLDLKPGGLYELTSTVTHDFKGSDIDFLVEAVAKFPIDPKTLTVHAGLKKDKTGGKAHVKTLAGDKVYCDVEGRLTTSDKPSGQYKVKLPSYIESSGDFNFDGSHLLAKGKLDLLKTKKSAEGKADLVIKDQKVSGSVDLCWDTSNPAKSIKIETDSSKATGDQKGFLTKNTLSYGDSKTIVNAKYLLDGKDVKSGKLPEKGSSSGELEIVLPDGTKVLSKTSGSWDVPGKQAERLYELLFHQANKSPQKVVLKMVGKNFNRHPLQLDSQVTLDVHSGDKDLTLHGVLKKVPKEGEKWIVKGEIGASGSVVQKPLTISLESELSEKLLEGKFFDENKGIHPMNYKFSLTRESSVSVESTGKLSSTTVAGELSAKLPEGKSIKSLKYVTTNVVDVLPSTTNKKLKTSHRLEWDDSHFWKVEAEGRLVDGVINYNLECEGDALQKRQIFGTAHYSGRDGVKADLTTNVAWEGKKAEFSAKVDANKDNSVVGAHITSNLPDKQKYDLALKNRIIKEGKGVHTDVTLSHDNKKLVASSKVEFDKNHPLLDINIDRPEGQSKLFFKADHKGHHHWSSAFKAKWSNNGGILSFENDANFGELDSLSLKSNVELPDHKKIGLDLNIKDGKKLSFSATKDDKPWMSGNANYEKKIEGNKKLVSGKGNVDIEGKNYPLKYEAAYEKLSEGNQMNLALEAGTRKVSVNLVNTPKEWSWERSYCKEDGKCSKALIMNKIKEISAENYEHISAVQLDLSVWGPQFHDISYDSHFKRHNFVVDHKIGLQWAEKSKVSYEAFVNEKTSGVILGLPKRTLGAELHYDIGRGEKIGNTKIGADLWLNKEKNDKLSLVASSVVTRNKDETSSSGKIVVAYPSLKKDLVISGKALFNNQGKVEGEAVVDIFKAPNQKLVATFKSNANLHGKNVGLKHAITLKSEGCKLNFATNYGVSLNQDEKSAEIKYVATWDDAEGSNNKLSFDVVRTLTTFNGKAHFPNGDSGSIESNYDTNKRAFSKSCEASLGGRKYHETLNILLNENQAKWTLSTDGKPIFLVEAGAQIGKTGVFKVLFKDKSAVDLNVALDESNFLKTKYNYDIDTIKAIWHGVTKELTTHLRGIDKQLVDSWGKGHKSCLAMLKCLSECIPDITQALEHIKGELKLIKEELLSDPTVKQLGQFAKDHLGKLCDQLCAIYESIEKFINSICSLLHESLKKGTALYKDISPKVQESVELISNLIVEVSEQVLQLTMKIFDAVLDELKKHEADIKAYIQSVTDFIHDFGKQFFQVSASIQEELKKLCDSVLENLSDFPLITMIKEKLAEAKDWKVSEEVWNVYFEVVEAVKAFLPTPECEDFIGTASDYFVKLLNKEDFNHQEAAKILATKGEAAVRSLINRISEFIPKQPNWKPSELWKLPISKWIRAPAGGVRVSAINYIVANGVPNAYKILSAYKPSLMEPLNNIPPFQGVGVLLSGSQIITFDGRHIDASGGSCSYVIAQDYVDQNFSLSAKFSGKWYLESITLADAKNSITVFHKSQPQLNGAPSDFPVYSGDLLAIRYPSGYRIQSKAGIKVYCDLPLALCQVEVSGFYFNKLRGLMGNLNYEPHDDWTVPSGDVASDVAAFATSWTTSPGCILSQKHNDARQDICTELFGKNPEVLIGKPWANTESWRAICDHSVGQSPADMRKKVACEVARGYVYYARKKGAFFLRLPSTCVECKLGNGESVEDFSLEDVKTEKAADVVLVVEASEDNKDTFNDLINPLIAELKPELAKKGFNDLQVTVISFYPNHWNPTFHTSNGQLAYDGKHINMHWAKRPVDANVTIEDKARHLLKQIQLETGSTSLSKAYSTLASHFAFRPHALKAILGVHGRRCHSPVNLFVPLRAALGLIYTEMKGVTFNLVAPVEDLEVDGIKTEDVVAFDTDQVVTLDGKVHEAEASYDLDYCVDSAELSGNVFPVENFKAAQAAGKGTDFVKAAAHRLAATMGKHANDKLKCHCNLSDGVRTQVSCYEGDLLGSSEEN